MISQDESTSPAAGAASHAPPGRSAFARYGFALLASVSALVLTVVLLEVSEVPIYAPLVGAVALTVWYGGFAPGVLVISLGWTLALWLVVEPHGAFWAGGREDLTRWGVNLAVAVVIVAVSGTLRIGRQRAAAAADVAEASVRDLASLQELAAALSAAVTPSEVAHVLITGTPSIIGARGGAVALAEGEQLVVVDAEGGAFETHRAGLRIPLSASAPVARAAASGVPVIVRDRQALERDYPDAIALTAYAQAAIAVPLRVGEDVVGSASFLFDRAEAMHDDAPAIAVIAVDLGGQALERARLYERERHARQGLDRILRISPRFHHGADGDVAEAVCREARGMFGADLGMLWRAWGDRLELLACDPALEPLKTGLEANLEEFPRLNDAIRLLQISFVEDLQEEARGVGLDRVRGLGIHSSLRAPIAIDGQVGLVLIVAWQAHVAEPDPSAILLFRRFADQAGLALEQLERRRAEEEAARRADETRRLQEITAALSLAATATEVSNTCLEHALAAVGAEAGFVALSRADGVLVELVASSGFDDNELETWSAFDLHSDVPFARAIATGDSVWALTPEAMAEFVGAREIADAGWATIPLKTSAGVRGALHLSFRTPRKLSDRERRWLQTVVSQCAQALERSRLFDEEQRLRSRAERLHAMTAALSNSLTRRDVADVVVEEVAGAVDGDGTALAVMVEERQIVRTLAWRGYSDEAVEPWLEVELETSTPGNRALRRRVPEFYETFDELSEKFPEAAETMEDLGHESFLFVPLVAERKSNGLLIVSWATRYSLSADERRFVESLSGQIAQALDRAGHFEAERTIAETLQRSVLPDSLPNVVGVQLAARYLPGTAELEVGGDWYDAISMPDGRLGLVVGDVVGKGVNAAASMAQLRNAVRVFSIDRMRPSATLVRLNRIAGEVLQTAFATMIYAVVDRERGICRFASAGHPPPLVALPDGRIELLDDGRGLPLGAARDTSYRQASCKLQPGSVMLLYTDGLVERRGQSLDEGLDALCRAVAEGPRNPEKLVDHVLAELVGSQERGDDIAILAIRLVAVAPTPLELSVPATPGSLENVRDALRAWLEGAPLARRDARDVVLATWEACANAVEHGPGQLLSVSARLADSAVRVTVEDGGRWSPVSERPDRGFGLQLIREMMSSMDIKADEKGTRVTFEKQFRRVKPRSSRGLN